MAIRTAFGLGLYGAPDDLGAAEYHGLPFTLEEVSGRRRGVRLRGWCLPEGTYDLQANRTVRTRRPQGQSEATQHIIGYDDGDTTIRGMWCTHHLEAGDYAVATTDGADQSAFRSAEDLREYMFSIVRAGMPVRVEWAGVERRTADIRLRVSHKSRVELSYELTFAWSGVGKFVQLPTTDSAEERATDLLSQAAELLALAATPANMALDLLDFVDTQMKRVEGLIVELRQTLELYASVLTRTTEVAGRVLGISTTLRNQAWALRDTIIRIPAEAGTNGIGDGGPAGAAEARVLAAWLAQTKRASTDTAASAARTAAVFAELTLPQIEAILTVQGDTDLRTIARQRYGSMNAWTRIAQYNGLTGSAVTAGQVIYIPRLSGTA